MTAIACGLFFGWIFNKTQGFFSFRRVIYFSSGNKQQHFSGIWNDEMRSQYTGSDLYRRFSLKGRRNILWGVNITEVIYYLLLHVSYDGMYVTLICQNELLLSFHFILNVGRILSINHCGKADKSHVNTKIFCAVTYLHSSVIKGYVDFCNQFLHWTNASKINKLSTSWLKI